jgi:hypothetical protein
MSNIKYDWTRADAAILTSYATFGGERISQMFGIPISSIRSRVKRLGVTGGTQGSADRRANDNSSVNQEFFRVWSANLAWLLGYIWADGSVSAKKSGWFISFRCISTDDHILDDIQCSIGSSKPIVRLKPKGLALGKYLPSETSGFQITSKNVVRLVVERYGIPPNKSNIDPPFPNVPDEWLGHFTRGVIDGDGSLFKIGSRGKVGVQILGSHSFVHELRDRVSSIVGVTRANCRKLEGWKGGDPKISAAKWTKFTDVVKLIRWLYPSGEYIALNRKKERAMTFLSGASGDNPTFRSRGEDWDKITREKLLELASIHKDWKLVAKSIGVPHTTLVTYLSTKYKIGRLESRLAGVRNSSSELTDEDVTAIRKRASAGDSYAKIAPDYNMTPEGISAIVRRKVWRHI